jgi:hypothetical protein
MPPRILAHGSGRGFTSPPLRVLDCQRTAKPGLTAKPMAASGG